MMFYRIFMRLVNGNDYFGETVIGTLTNNFLLKQSNQTRRQDQALALHRNHTTAPDHEWRWSASKSIKSWVVWLHWISLFVKKGQEIPFLNLTVTDWVSLTLLAWLGPCWLLEPVYSPLSLYSSFTFQLCSYKSTLALFRVFRSRNTCSPSNKTNKSKTWLCACYVCCSTRDLKMNHVDNDNPLRLYFVHLQAKMRLTVVENELNHVCSCMYIIFKHIAWHTEKSENLFSTSSRHHLKQQPKYTREIHFLPFFQPLTLLYFCFSKLLFFSLCVLPFSHVLCVEYLLRPIKGH